MDLDARSRDSTCARRHSANSQLLAGKAMRASRLIFSNSSRRLRLKWRNRNDRSCVQTSAIAALHLVSEKKVSPRSRPRM